MTYLAKNNANSVLAAAVVAADTSITVSAGQGDRFPVVASPDYTLVTLENAAGNREIVKVTARAASVDILTVVRAQEGTTALAWNIGDVVSQRLTAGLVAASIAHPTVTPGAHAASAISVTPVGNIASTNVQAALSELDTEKTTQAYVDAQVATKAALAGSAAQTFAVANAAASNQAVNKGQADATYQPVGNYQAALGYTPVQQGTGVRQGANAVKLGWTGGRVAMTVDISDMGDIANTNDINNLQNQINGLSFVTKDQNYNNVGSFCTCLNISGNPIGPGVTVAGSLLQAAGVGYSGGALLIQSSGAALSGTWRCLGVATYDATYSGGVALFQRIA